MSRIEEPRPDSTANPDAEGDLVPYDHNQSSSVSLPARALEQVVADIDRSLGHAPALERGEGLGQGGQGALSAAGGERHLVFDLAGTRFAAVAGGVAGVVEVVEAPALAPVPKVPIWLRGVTNLRGDIIAVVDLRLFFGFEEVARPQGVRMLVASARGELVAGLLVDRLYGATNLVVSELHKTGSALGGPVAPFVAGIHRHPDADVLAVLDLEKLLGSPELRKLGGR